MASDFLTQEELQELENCPNDDAWDALCDKIKKARGGGYPRDWWRTVFAKGGIAERLTKKWNNPTAFNIEMVTFNDSEEKKIQ